MPSSVDIVDNIVWGTVSSFSLFAIFVDDAPPEIQSISASPNVLWPADHKMVEVRVTVDAKDNSDQTPMCVVVRVKSNEASNGPGDGNTEPDWQFTDDDLTVLLRAERNGGGTGRVYTIYVTCTDGSGNFTDAAVEVTVPHDKGKGKK